MTQRPHNFNAGPAILPLSVMEEVQGELLNTNGTGLSVMEWSHRSSDYEAVRQDVEARFWRLLGQKGDHPFKLLLGQGGASQQFATVPMNLASSDRPGSYVLTGSWSKKAFAEAEKMGRGHLAWSGADVSFNRIPTDDEWSEADQAAYVHITTNNTIFGTEFAQLPKTKAPLVCDMSSDILSGPIDLSNVGLIYAGAQKNLGPAGVTVVIVREEWLGESPQGVPSIFDYRTHLKAKGIYNTPNTFGVYLMGKVLAWVESQGGVEGIAEKNRQKAALLYDIIDGSDFWRGTADKTSRSKMNVCWRLPSEDLEKKFIAEATEAQFIGLKGHRSVGGCRASIYNAMPRESVEALVGFMTEFASRNQ